MTRALVNEALRLDPDCANAHASPAWITSIYEWGWERAEAEFRRTMEIDPSTPWGAHGRSDLLATTGRTDEALVAGAAALEHDPLAGYIDWQVGFPHWTAGDYTAAVRPSRGARPMGSWFRSCPRGRSRSSQSAGSMCFPLVFRGSAVGG